MSLQQERGARRADHRHNEAITVVIADHQHLPRQALRCLLESVTRCSVVGEVTDALRIPAALGRLRPDVLLVDFDIHPLDGADVTRAVRQQFPDVRVVVVSRSTSDFHLVQCLRSGASGYVAKSADHGELTRAIEQAANGGAYVSAPFSRRPVEYWVKRSAEAVEDPYDILTPRERQTLHLVAQGLSSTAIAQRLGISKRTVESHREHLKMKLGVRNHAGLVRYAVERQVLGGSARN